MSAALSPVCGRASIEFSIFTASAGRLTSAVVCTPVSGQGVVGGGGGVVGAVVVFVAEATGLTSANELQAVTVSSTATSPAAARRREAAGSGTPELSAGVLPLATLQPGVGARPVQPSQRATPPWLEQVPWWC